MGNLGSIPTREIAIYKNIRQEIVRKIWSQCQAGLLCTAISFSSPYGVFARVLVSTETAVVVWLV